MTNPSLFANQTRAILSEWWTKPII